MLARYVLIVAGGSGRRMETEVPKQFLLLNGKPVLMHTFEVFYRFSSTISFVLVLPDNEIALWKQLCMDYSFTIPHYIVTGGDTRFQSVKNGLSLIKEECIVAVHDGVRPLTSIATIEKAFAKAELHGNAVPVIPVNESLREMIGQKSAPADRSRFFIVQTPQCFRISLLKEAYKQTYQEGFTDDATVVEALGETIHLTEGNFENIKITYPTDLKIAWGLIGK